MTFHRIAPWLLAILALLAWAPAQSDYDPDAEIQRLIDLAREDIRKSEAAITELQRSHDGLRQVYSRLNDSALQVADVLRKARVADARNKALLLIRTGLLITAVNVPGKLAELGVNFAVDRASEYLQGRHPQLFDTTLTVTLPRVTEDSVTAVQKLNWVISLSDQAVSAQIRMESPDLAEKDLSGDLIILYRSRWIIEAGVEAERRLDQAKSEVAGKVQAFKAAIKHEEDEIKRRQDDIRSWERNRDVNRSLRAIPPIQPPQPVQYNTSASLDFGAAAAQMRGAWGQLKANQVDCQGYHVLIYNAQAAADARLYELYLQQVWPACAGNWFGDACRAAVQRFDDTVRRDHKAQLDAAGQWISARSAEEKARFDDFKARFERWRDQTITVPTFGQLQTTTTQPGWGQLGVGLAGAVWSGSEIGLPPSYVDQYWSEMQLPVGNPPLLAQINQTWQRVNEHVRDLEHDLALAERADGDARAAVHEIEALVREWEPNLQVWSCWGVIGTYQDMHMLPPYKTFATLYEAGAREGREVARRYVQAAKERLAKLNTLASAYSGEPGLLRTLDEATRIRDKLFDLQRQGIGLNSPNIGYALWQRMVNAGVTQAMVQELAEAVPKLRDDEFALKYVLGLSASRDRARKPVLGEDALSRLREGLKADAAFLVPIYNDYQSLHPRLKAKQAELDRGYQALRQAVEGVLGEPAESIAAPLLLDPRFFMEANDFPDPTAGVFEQLDQYEKLARQYHAIVEPLHPPSFHLVEPLDALRKKLELERGNLMGLDPAGMSAGLQAYSQEAARLQAQALRGGGRLTPQALFNKAYGKLMALITEIGGTYNQNRKAAEVAQQLNRLVRDVSTFLARPESEGGPAAATSWISAVEAVLAPGSEARQLSGLAGIGGLLQQLTGQSGQLRSYLASGGDAAVRQLYQDFAAAYQDRNLAGIARMLMPDWKASDGSDLSDLEDNLSNSFRVFDRVQYTIGNLSISPLDAGRFQVSYSATITGQIHSLNLRHQETSSVTDIVVLTPNGPRIQSTSGGKLWLQ